MSSEPREPSEEELRAAYEHGHPWPRFVEIEEQRLEDAQRAREHFFTELLEPSGRSADAVGCFLGTEDEIELPGGNTRGLLLEIETLAQ